MKQIFKNYIVFQFDQYYPCGGLNDITGSFDTLGEAITFVGTDYHDYSEIVRRDTWELVWTQD